MRKITKVIINIKSLFERYSGNTNLNCPKISENIPTIINEKAIPDTSSMTISFGSLDLK